MHNDTGAPLPSPTPLSPPPLILRMTDWKAIRQFCDYGLERREGTPEERDWQVKSTKKGLEEDKIRVEMKKKIRSEKKRWGLTVFLWENRVFMGLMAKTTVRERGTKNIHRSSKTLNFNM